MAIKACPECSHEMASARRICPQCSHEFYAAKKLSVITSGASRMNGGNNGYEELVREQSTSRPYNPDRESDHDKQVLQKAMLPEWFYLGRHQFMDHNGKAVGAATYNAYNPKYNGGSPISYSEFHMLVAAIVRIADTGNPEGKRTKQKVSS